MRIVGKDTVAYAITGTLTLKLVLGDGADTDAAPGSITDSSTVTLRLTCPPGRLGKVVHNDQVATLVDAADAEADGDNHAVAAAQAEAENHWIRVPLARLLPSGAVALRYRTAPTFRPIPLKVVPSWAVAPQVTNLAVSYCAHPLLAAPLSDCSFVVPVRTVTEPAADAAPADPPIGRMQLKPPGLWSAAQGKLLWKVASIAAADGPAKLLAKFETHGGAGEPSPVTVRFRCDGVNLSGARIARAGGVSVTERRSFAAGKVVIEPSAAVE
jgi:hypothetical protein